MSKKNVKQTIIKHRVSSVCTYDKEALSRLTKELRSEYFSKKKFYHNYGYTFAITTRLGSI